MKNVTYLIIFAVVLTSCKESHLKIVPGTNLFTEVWDGWEITKIKTDSALGSMDVYFLDENNGFVSGGRGLHKTSDAGKSWLRIDINTNLPLTTVFFINEQLGFTGSKGLTGCKTGDCGKGSGIFKTIDGGQTWSKVFFEEYYYIHSLRFTTEKIGFAVGEPIFDSPQLIRTVDGGETWEVVVRELGTGRNAPLFCVIDNTLFLLTFENKILKSQDSGETWMEINRINPDIYLGIKFIDEQTGFIYSTSKISKTTDGGASWRVTNFPHRGLLPLVHFVNDKEIFGISSSEKGKFGYETSDGGITWKESKTVYPSLSMEHYHFPRQSIGFGAHGEHFYVIQKKDSQ